MRNRNATISYRCADENDLKVLIDLLFEEMDDVLIHHPSGTLAVQAEVSPVGDVLRTSVIRTMRTIMRGELLLAKTTKQL